MNSAAIALYGRVQNASSSAMVDFFIAARELLRHRRRSFVGMAAVVSGVVALLLAAGFIEWIYMAMREDTIHSGLGHMHVVRGGYGAAGSPDSYKYLLPEHSPERDLIARFPGVTKVAPRLSFSGLISLKDATLSFIGEGMDPASESELADATILIAGVGLSALEPNGIIMGQGLADNLGARVGDTVVMVANTGSGSINAVEAKIRGTFATVSKAYDDAALRAPLRMAQELLRVSGAHRWVVFLDGTDKTQAAVGELKRRLSGKDLEVLPWYDMADFYNKTIVLYSKQVAVLKLIIAVIIILSVSNTLTTTIMERTGEIGTAMALGVPRARLLRRFVFEGMLIGIVGGIIGVALGYLLAKAISTVGIPMPPPPGMAHGFIGRILVTPALAFDAVLLALVTTVLASIYPAWKASRMAIVDALRSNR